MTSVRVRGSAMMMSARAEVASRVGMAAAGNLGGTVILSVILCAGVRGQ